MTAVPPACKLDERRFATASAQAEALADAVASQLREAVAQRGVASLAVSGGRSPIAFFEHLRVQPLPWEHVTVTLVDERCVAGSHADSNAHLVREHLLQDRAADATFIDWLEGVDAPESLTPSALVDEAKARLQGLPWPLDVAVLGMGEDGHTASWFPDSPGLAVALAASEPVTWVRPAQAPHLRLTLTLNALLACRQRHLSIAGQVKQQVFAAARQGVATDKPIHTLLARADSLDVWISD
jgi:6-phosphogluconolactonase